MRIEMNVKGAKELDDMLRQLPASVSRKSAGTALREGAKVLRDEARRLAPVGPAGYERKLNYADAAGGKTNVGSGVLRRAISIKTDRFEGGRRRRVVVVVSAKRAGINPHWLEYGTVSQRVAKSGGYMTFVIDGRFVRKKAVAGVKGRAFMRGAADTKWREAVQVIGIALGRAVELEAYNLGTRAKR